MKFKEEIIYETRVTIVVALSEKEIGKVILPNPLQWVSASTGEPVDFGEEPTFEDELIQLIIANGINDLLPKFIRKQKWTHPKTSVGHDMIVMERLYALPKNHFDVATRKKMFAVFETKMKELHDNYFVHGDIMRPTRFWNRGDMEFIFGNIIQTEKELRLIDTGFSKTMSWKKDNEAQRKRFFTARYYENEEVQSFKEYYLSL